MSVIRGTLPDVFARLLVLTAAFGLAFVAGRATVPAPNTPEAAPPHHEVAGIPVAELPVDCEARRERVEAERDQLVEAIRQAELELRMQRAAREAREGPVQPWTDDIAPRLRPEAFRSAVVDALEEVGGYGDLEFDCDEFPCLVAVTFEGVTGTNVSTEHLEPLWEALREAGYDLPPSVSLSPFPVQHALFALLPEGASDDLKLRVSTRSDRMMRRRSELLEERAR